MSDYKRELPAWYQAGIAMAAERIGMGVKRLDLDGHGQRASLPKITKWLTDCRGRGNMIDNVEIYIQVLLSGAGRAVRIREEFQTQRKVRKLLGYVPEDCLREVLNATEAETDRALAIVFAWLSMLDGGHVLTTIARNWEEAYGAVAAPENRERLRRLALELHRARTLSGEQVSDLLQS